VPRERKHGSQIGGDTIKKGGKPDPPREPVLEKSSTVTRVEDEKGGQGRQSVVQIHIQLAEQPDGDHKAGKGNSALTDERDPTGRVLSGFDGLLFPIINLHIPSGNVRESSPRHQKPGKGSKSGQEKR